MKYTKKHLNCSGSIKYTEIYGYYEIQCPNNVSTCINQPDQTISIYVDKGTQCGLYRNYDECKQKCQYQCLYHTGEKRIEMRQDIFIPNVPKQTQMRYAPSWYYYCPDYIDWRDIGLKCSFVVLFLYAVIIGLIIFIQLVKLCKKFIPAYYICPFEQKVQKMYISDDVYGVKERKRMEEQQKKQTRKSKKQE